MSFRQFIKSTITMSRTHISKVTINDKLFGFLQPIQVYARCNDTVSIHANVVVICNWGGRGSSSFMFSFIDTCLPSTNKETFT
ncbi:unnamed protein product [Ixodes pacificus]